MLNWKKDINGYNGHWMGGYVGFDDDCPLYKVGEDDNGWYYEYLPDADGMDGYDTAEEAMAAAEFEYTSNQIEIEWDAEPLTIEEAEEILGDILFEEYREAKMGW
jgi:hypothetical protein